MPDPSRLRRRRFVGATLLVLFIVAVSVTTRLRFDAVIAVAALIVSGALVVAVLRSGIDSDRDDRP